MKLWGKAGFTIIETMLFLGITSLLVLGVLVGTGTSINIQRYRDSVSSLQAFLQQQYSDVSNVSNDSAGNLVCYGDDSTEPRGQSDCVILGRYITTTDSHTLSIRSVLGFIPANSILLSNDVGILELYNVKVSSVTTETYEIEWDSSLAQPKPNDDSAMLFSMLVLRSPSSGIIRTFINPNAVVADKDVSTLVNSKSLGESAKMCVNSNGLFVNARTAVQVIANAASASGVEMLEEATSGC